MLRALGPKKRRTLKRSMERKDALMVEVVMAMGPTCRLVRHPLSFSSGKLHPQASLPLICTNFLVFMPSSYYTILTIYL